MLKRENTQQSRGKVEDIWDQGLMLVEVLKWFAVAMGVCAGLLALSALVLFAMGRSVVGTLIGVALVGGLALAAVGGRAYLLSENAGVPFSIVLGVIVGLLSVEWLTRKLLRLA
jgi:hypothetical protein